MVPYFQFWVDHFLLYAGGRLVRDRPLHLRRYPEDDGMQSIAIVVDGVDIPSMIFLCSDIIIWNVIIV